MDNYEPLDPIGSGSFGIIRKVRRITDGKLFARKEIAYSKMSEKEKRQLVAEVNILRELRHPNIVRYLERVVDKSTGTIYIIMEYCEGGDLAAIIRKCKKELKRIPEDIIWTLFTQLILALHECHNANGTRPAVLHRDIKPDNVFLDSNQNIKLGDFGLSRAVEHPENDFAKTYVGTPFYMSPELVTESCYNTKSDIWALGCLIYELCALEPPFQAKSQTSLALKIRQGKINTLPSMYSSELNRVIRYLLQIDHTKRPGTSDLLQLDRVRFNIRDKEVQLLQHNLQIKEAELRAYEKKLRLQDEEIRIRVDELEKREALLLQQESLLREREKRLDMESRKFKIVSDKYKERNGEIKRNTSISAYATTPPQYSRRSGISGGLVGVMNERPSPKDRTMSYSP